MFKRAERKRAFIKLAITGPSGSGKTYSALRLAFGLGKKVALIDTENGSGNFYADVNRDGIGEYAVCELTPPFTTQSYIRAINAAIEAGFEVLIIDSLTHAWAGPGGLLEQKEALDKRGGNQYTNWAPITKLHEEFKAAILHAPIHIIGTMRSKQEYVVDQNERGKSAPRKVGMAPIQRDGMEYEFTLVFDVAQDHSAIASKDRTALFDQFTGRLTDEHGRMIAGWLNSGAAPTPEPIRPAAAPESSGDAAVAKQPPARASQAVAAGETAGSYAGATVKQAKPNGEVERARGRFFAVWKERFGATSDAERYAILTHWLRQRKNNPEYPAVTSTGSWNAAQYAAAADWADALAPADAADLLVVAQDALKAEPVPVAAAPHKDPFVAE